MFKKTVLATLIAVLLTQATGCSIPFSREHQDPETPKSLEREKLTYEQNENEATLEVLGFDMNKAFILEPMLVSQPLPDRTVAPISFTDANLNDALRLLLAEHGISLSIDQSERSAQSVYGAVSAFDVKGNLQQVINELSEAMGFFWRYENGVMHIYPEQPFILEIPPVVNKDSMASMTNTFKFLGAKDVYLDHQNKSLFFRANKKSAKAVKAYLDSVRANRSMLAFDISIMQVDLTDTSQYGVNWKQLQDVRTVNGTTTGVGIGGPANNNGGGFFTPGKAAAGIASTAAGTTGFFGASFIDGRTTAGLILEFLKTQGSVKVLSQPKMAMMSGSKGKISVGGTTTYVSKVGTNSGYSFNQVTVETKDLQTGVQLGLFGDISDGTVYINVNLSMQDLIRMNQFEALGTKLQLPETSVRDIETTVRARPGDLILLGGITLERDSDEGSSSIGGVSNSKNKIRSELVLAIKPKIIRFKPVNYGIVKVADIPKAAPLPVATISTASAPVNAIETKQEKSIQITNLEKSDVLKDGSKPIVETKKSETTVEPESIKQIELGKIDVKSQNEQGVATVSSVEFGAKIDEVDLSVQGGK